MTTHEKLMRSPKCRRLYYLSGAGIDAAELVARLLENEHYGWRWLGNQLREKCAISDGKQVVNRLLSHGEVSLQDLAAMLYELGYELKLSARRLPEPETSNQETNA